MAWLRLDDRFDRHPKITALGLKEFKVWISVLLYCAMYETEGHVPEHASISGLSESMRIRYRELALIDRVEGEDIVHDWAKFNPKDPTSAQRQKRFRNAKSNGESNGGNRYNERNDDVTVTEPHARAGARVPVPSLKTEPTAAAGSTPETAAANELRIRLRELGWREWQVSAGLADPDRAYAWLKRATREAQVNPGGYAWTGFQSGDEPGLSSPDGVRYTGCKEVRGSHSLTHIPDPLGTDREPEDWPYPKPEPSAIRAALKAKGEA